MRSKIRCGWVPLSDELYIRYHDEEWGVPVYNDVQIFEHLLLETSQAGLSWLTILRKRQNYRLAFADFDAHTIATFTNDDIERLMQDVGIVSNRQKIMATISNAQAFIKVQNEFGSFATYQWQFVHYKPTQNAWPTIVDVPIATPVAQELSDDLRRRGFRFVGPTTIYAHMQAVGMVNDHTTDCFRYAEVAAM